MGSALDTRQILKRKIRKTKAETAKTKLRKGEFPTRKFDPPKNRRVNFMPVGQRQKRRKRLEWWRFLASVAGREKESLSTANMRRSKLESQSKGGNYGYLRKTGCSQVEG
jgi:hypothetical protein